MRPGATGRAHESGARESAGNSAKIGPFATRGPRARGAAPGRCDIQASDGLSQGPMSLAGPVHEVDGVGRQVPVTDGRGTRGSAFIARKGGGVPSRTERPSSTHATGRSRWRIVLEMVYLRANRGRWSGVARKVRGRPPKHGGKQACGASLPACGASLPADGMAHCARDGLSPREWACGSRRRRPTCSRVHPQRADDPCKVRMRIALPLQHGLYASSPPSLRCCGARRLRRGDAPGRFR